MNVTFVFKFQEINPIYVLQYEELIADKIYSKVKGYIENLSRLFPRIWFNIYSSSKVLLGYLLNIQPEVYCEVYWSFD